MFMPKVTSTDGVYKIIHVGMPHLSRLRVNRALDSSKIANDPDQVKGQANGVRWLIEGEVPGKKGPINGWFGCHEGGQALFFLDPDEAVAKAEKIAQMHMNDKTGFELGQADVKPKVEEAKEELAAQKAEK
jgi:hypothetical protein